MRETLLLVGGPSLWLIREAHVRTRSQKARTARETAEPRAGEKTRVEIEKPRHADAIIRSKVSRATHCLTFGHHCQKLFFHTARAKNALDFPKALN